MAVIKGLALRPSVPDFGAVARSLLGVLVIAAIGLWVVGPTAAMAAAGAATIAGATALQDSPHGRIPLVVGVSVAMGLAVLVGASTSAYSMPFIAVVAVGCFLAGLAWAAGTNPGLIAAAAAVLLVTAPPVPPTWTTVSASVLLAVVGGLAQAALIGLWPRRRWRVQREALTRAYRSLAADARALAADPSGHIEQEPLRALREAFTFTHGQAVRHPLAYRAWYGLPERIAVTLAALAGRSRGDNGVSSVLAAAADVLDAVSRPTRANAKATGYAMGRFDAVAASTAELESPLVRRLSAQLRDAAALRFGDGSADVVPAGRSEANGGVQHSPGLVGTLAHAVAMIRDQLSAESPVMRHAIRLGLAAGCGVAIARVAEVAHGYWIPLTVVMVLRPETAHTYTRCAGRVAGNVAGVILATGIALVLHPAGLFAAVFAVVLLGVAYAVSGWGYVAVSAALAAAIVFFVDVSGAASLATMGDRVLATLIGGVLAVLAHVALPDRDDVRLRQRAGELLKAEIDYAATVIKASVHDVDRPGEMVASSWERAFRARAAFEAAAASGLMNDRHLRRWLSSYRAGLNAVTASCTALEANLPARRAATTSTALRSAVDEFVEALRGDPQTAGSPWTLDVDVLTAAAARVRAELSDVDDASARVLLTEIDAVTERLVDIATAIPD
ncbi:fusaric acid resistance protein [Mycolicibacterium arabiense]|uniref:Fusaric acid resistance protein n=1 Tax=Mycolicibacterium arabiense TaxID=1286181 RepID=A0A7I7RTC7_9MYCO|nr:FUSC family protein [Mycolicibacterium arabiense]BBY47450.1 fusaric acid resistance protein [Mycolicibacterium arabiense]